MTKDEKLLLENLLGSLDRLFDRVSTVTDVHALLFATSKALAGSTFQATIESFVDKVLVIARTRSTAAEMRREAALIATVDLRKFLADALPKPTI